MLGIKKLLAGLVIGIALGLWWGVNIGRGLPFYSNPFKTAQDRAKDRAHEIIEGARGIFK